MKSRTVVSLSTLAFTLLLTTACQQEDFQEESLLVVPDQLTPDQVPESKPSQDEPEEAFLDAISDEASGLMWMRCEHGLSYNEVINWCVGASENLEYCQSQDNSCNGEMDQGELEPDGGSALFEACDSLNEDEGAGGYTDWRVPTADELAELYDTVHAVNIELMPNTRPSWYWSSTSDTNRNALMVSFESGEVGSYPKLGRYPVRCVRDL